MKTILYKLILVLICVHFINITLAQDVIVKTNGDEIIVKVTEITDVQIKYHKFDNLNGPVYNIDKSEVFMIKYENGTKDVFEKQDVKKVAPVQEKPKAAENIIIKRNRYYYQGKLLNERQIKEILRVNASPEIQQEYTKGCNNKMISDIFSYSGCLIFLAGDLIYLSSNQTSIVGRSMMFSGFGIMTVSIPFFYIGKSQKKKSIIKYNNSVGASSEYKPELYFGFSPNSIILSVKF